MFILSKIIGFLLDPFLWILTLAVIFLFVRDRLYKKRLRNLLLLLFLFFSNPYIIDNIWLRYQWKPVQLPAGKSYQTGILLGGMAGYDENSRQGYFGPAADRFIQAARLYHQGQIQYILVSGGNAIFVKERGYNEADFIAGNLEALKIPRDHIIVERKARNTIENATYSKQLLDSLNNKSSLLITSAFHMPRAMKAFHRAGIVADPFPCNYRVLPTDAAFSWRSMIPSPEAFNRWTLILKEWVGLLQLAN